MSASPEDKAGRGAAAYSVFLEQRLVAKVWPAAGKLFVAGKQEREPLLELAWGEVALYDRRSSAVFVEVAQKADSVDAFVFKLGMEGFDVRPGDVAPGPAHRRF